MMKMIIHGCNGVMGQNVAEMAAKDAKVMIVAGIDYNVNARQNPFPVFSALTECDVEADVVVDFSSAVAVDGLLDACVAKRLPLVLCTTGLSEEQLAHVAEASKVIPILRSGNMSLGINLLMKVVEEVAGVLLSAEFDT